MRLTDAVELTIAAIAAVLWTIFLAMSLVHWAATLGASDKPREEVESGWSMHSISLGDTDRYLHRRSADSRRGGG